jgi:hypothetical protein
VIQSWDLTWSDQSRQFFADLGPAKLSQFFSLGWTNTKPVTDRIKVYPMAIYNMHLFCITAAPRKRLAANILVPCEYWANKTSRNTAGLLESVWGCLSLSENRGAPKSMFHHLSQSLSHFPSFSIIYLKTWVTFHHFPVEFLVIFIVFNGLRALLAGAVSKAAKSGLKAS